ncbi:MAG TPA: hypothetical protein VEJ84_10140 [Acidimicrobiales bacterium]|nr:hypothetical protein [Acidimicrobiales bacterium]
MEKLSRRSALKGIGMLAGGTVVSSTGLSVASGSAGAVEPRAMDGGTTFVVFASGLRAVGRPGRAAGDHVVTRGDLSLEEGGAVVGRFLSTATLLDTPSRFRLSSGSLAVQTFSLEQGDIVGTGTLNHEGTGTLAVTGGTGAFNGARGSYTVIQDGGSFGGGHAVYTFTLLTPEARP